MDKQVKYHHRESTTSSSKFNPYYRIIVMMSHFLSVLLLFCCFYWATFEGIIVLQALLIISYEHLVHAGVAAVESLQVSENNGSSVFVQLLRGRDGVQGLKDQLDPLDLEDPLVL